MGTPVENVSADRNLFWRFYPITSPGIFPKAKVFKKYKKNLYAGSFPLPDETRQG